MSVPTAESSAAPSGVALIAIALGLFALASIGASLVMGSGGPTDGNAVMMRVFGAADMPFGMQEVSATKLADGGTLVVHERPGAPPETPRAKPVDEPSSDSSVFQPFDWTKLEISAISGPPRQAAFLFVPAAKGSAVLDEMIRNVYGRDRGQLGSEGGTVMLERGRIDYRGWNSDWIHLRTYERGGTFRDAMRISLSTPEDPCVLTATWSRGVPASLAVLQDLIRPLVQGQ